MERRNRKMETKVVAVGLMLAFQLAAGCDQLGVGLEDLEEFAADGASDTVEMSDSSDESTKQDTASDTSDSLPAVDTTAEDTETVEATDPADQDSGDNENAGDTETEFGSDDDGCTCVCVCDNGESSDADTDSDADGDTDMDADTDADSDSDTDGDIDSDTETEAQISDDCVIISEYIEGSSWNKGIEVFNCGDESVVLDGYTLCVYTNDSVECSSDVALSGALAAGEVVTICHNSAEDIGECDLRTGTANFSGDDRAALLRDGVVVDAFGELAVRPEGSPWANITLRRCNAAPYLGVGIFDLTTFYSIAESDDFFDFGLPPSVSSCD